MDSLLQDFRYAWRALINKPGFLTVAALTLAIGIGANIAIFSTVNALLLRPYPFPQLDSLVLVKAGSDSVDDQRQFSPADFVDLRHEVQSFSGIAAYRGGDFNLKTGERIESVVGYAVTANLLDLVGARAAEGRIFAAGEDQPGNDQTALISYGFWQRRFGGNPKLLGQTIQVNGRTYSIAGIMPDKFNFPLAAQVWIPLALDPQQQTERGTLSLTVLGRLKPGVTLKQAAGEINAFDARLKQRYPKTNANRTMTLLRLREQQYQYTAPMFLMLQAAALFVLLLACANLANLMFARVLTRQRELAIREALGAGRRRMFQLMLSEAIILSVVGGVCATAISIWGVDLVRKAMPPGMTEWIAGWDSIRVDAAVLGFALLLTLGVAIFFAIGTAIQSSRFNLNQVLKEGGGTATSAKGRARLRSALVTAQVVLAMLLLVGAGSLIKSFNRLVSVFGGFEPAGVLTFQTHLPKQRYPSDVKVADFYRDAISGLYASPGVTSAAIVSNLPASNVDNSSTPFTIAGRPALRAAETPVADLQTASAGIFRTLKVGLLHGRLLSDTDDRNAPRVAVISRAMAARFWPREDAVGKTLKLGYADAEAPWITVVGVVEDIKQNWFDTQPQPTIYLPHEQAPSRNMYFAVRTAGDPMSVTSAARAMIQRLDAQMAVTEVNTLTREIDDSISPVRIIGRLMIVFGGMALLLAGVGMYGLLAHAVAQRTHEFGVRMALGADSRALLKLVLGQALTLCGVGVMVALPIVIVLGTALAKLVFGLLTLNPAMICGLSLLLISVALAAAYVPARRAMRVDPLIALRYE